jgi:hypothetical protein
MRRLMKQFWAHIPYPYLLYGYFAHALLKSG